MSMIWSAARITSSSCSTTITVLPKSRKDFKTLTMRSVSLGWRPMLGSSNTYIEPTSALPSEVASLIRWYSPPDNVEVSLLRVRYPSPTLSIYSKRDFISLRMRSEIFLSWSPSFRPLKKVTMSSMGINTRSVMEVSAIFTYCASFRSRVPLQSGQVVRPR